MPTITLQETRIDALTGEFAYYDRWVESLDLPIYEGYYVEDLRTLGLGRWDQRGVDAAFLQLAGQQGVSGVYVTEVRPGDTTPPFKMAIDECIYVLSGSGLTTVHGTDSGTKKTFEWQKYSMFMIPANHTYQISNTSGNQPLRLLHSNYLPLAMSVIPNHDFYFNNPVVESERIVANEDGEFYSIARAFDRPAGPGRPPQTWVGNFFPDMRAWDQLVAFKGRGGGGTAVYIEFPHSPMMAHMSVFPPQSYKKAHRHGGGFVIVIPAGEGYSVMWQDENAEKIMIPWHEASCFVPPFRWFHQHFNVSEHPDRYLAIHPPRGLSSSGEGVQDPTKDQIEYVDEDPWIRRTFEAELAKRSLKSVMPDQAYKDKNYEWSY